MFSWSISARAWRSASKRATTWRVSKPGLLAHRQVRPILRRHTPPRVGHAGRGRLQEAAGLLVGRQKVVHPLAQRLVACARLRQVRLPLLDGRAEGGDEHFAGFIWDGS